MSKQAKKSEQVEQGMIEVTNNHNQDLGMPCGTVIPAGKSDTIEVVGGKDHPVIKQWVKAEVIKVK